MGSCQASACESCEAREHEQLDEAGCEPLRAGFPANDPIPRKKIDFESESLVPEGWRVAAAPAPDRFLVLGGDACVIEPATRCQRSVSRRGGVSRQWVGEGGDDSISDAPRVLLALPDWAVDVARAQWLTRLPPGPDWQVLTRLWCVCPAPSLKIVTFVFDMPPVGSRSVQSWVEDEIFTDAIASHVHGEVLRLLLCLPTLRFWGLFRPELVHLDEQGCLSAVLPLGCLLAFQGARAAIHNAPAVAPELTKAVARGDESLGTSRGRSLAVDAHGVAAMVLGALGGGSKGCAGLSDGAKDLLGKALREDPDSRLGAGAALCHPWLSSIEAGDPVPTHRSGSTSCRRAIVGGSI